MRIATRVAARIESVGTLGLNRAVLVVVAGSVAAGTWALAGRSVPHLSSGSPTAAEAAVQPAAPPSAAEFGHLFVGVTNEYASSHGDAARIGNPDCVQASPGHYMCAYSVARPGRSSECHLMQAIWTPLKLSSFTVTLAGRSLRCGSLREAVRSLR